MRRLVVLLLLIVVPVAAAPTTSARGTDKVPARRIVIVSVPTLTWDTVERERPPAIQRLLSTSAIAALSVRTIGPRSTVGEGYVTIGAGNRATVRPEAAGAAFAPDERVEGARATSVFTMRTGAEAAGSAFQLEVVDVHRSATRLRYGAEPGALGEALRVAGLRTAVIANSDGPGLRGPEVHREAALSMMDADGRVAGGSVDPRLSTPDPASPFGLRADEARVNAALDEALVGDDVVLVEASDYARLDRYRTFMTDQAQSAAQAAALASADGLVAHVLDRVDLERDVVMLLAPAAPLAAERLTVFSVAGPGFEPGRARSATTRRAGYVTLPDIAPTVLHALGVEAPTSMSGTLISSDGSGPPDTADIARLNRVDEIARFRDRVVGPVSVTFIVLQVLVYALAAFATGRRIQRLGPYVAGGALLILATPPVVFLSGLVRYDALGVVGYTVAVFAAAGALGVVAWVLGRRSQLLAPGLLIGLTLGVLLVDVVTGARLQINTAFGYSPIVAGRFAGYGNLAFALVAMAAIVVGTMLWARGAGTASFVAPAMLFGAVLLVDGYPSFGSDVGGVLATLPAFAVVLLMLRGTRVSWPRIASIAVASVGLVSVLAAVDLARPEERRTHLGRFASRLLDGDVGTILQRKASANVSLLTSSVWTYVIPVALAFLVFLTWRPTGFLRELQRSVPGLRPCLVGALVAGVLGFGLNDSGVAVPAMMFGILLPYLTWLLVWSTSHGEARAER
ncbi:MAG: hypothetical protein ACT4OV_01705 [Microthrixaceae bacterium]